MTTTREKVERQRQTVNEARAEHERARTMYEDEPTRAHHDYAAETKRELRFYEAHLAKFEQQLAEESAASR